MAEVLAFAYPPGREDDGPGIMVHKRDMERYSQTFKGVPLNSEHPAMHEGQPADKYRVGEVVESMVDPKTGAIVNRARLDDTLDGWSEYHDIASGYKRQFSTQKGFHIDPDTWKAYGHQAHEVSSVHQGDNEHGANFATSILDVRLPGGEQFCKRRDDILRSMNTSQLPDDALSSAMGDHQQQPETTQQQAPDRPLSRESPSAADAEAAVEARMQREFEKREQRSNKELHEELSLLKKKYEEVTGSASQMQEVIKELSGKIDSNRRAAAKQTQEVLSSWLASKMEQMDPQKKDALKKWENRLFEPNKDTGMISDMQHHTQAVFASAMQDLKFSHSQMDAAVRKLAEREERIKSLERRLGIQDSVRAGSRAHPYAKASASRPQQQQQQQVNESKPQNNWDGEGRPLAMQPILPFAPRSKTETFFG